MLFSAGLIAAFLQPTGRILGATTPVLALWNNEKIVDLMTVGVGGEGSLLTRSLLVDFERGIERALLMGVCVKSIGMRQNEVRMIVL